MQLPLIKTLLLSSCVIGAAAHSHAVEVGGETPSHNHKQNHFPLIPYVFGSLQAGGEDIGNNPHLNIGSGGALGVGLALKAPNFPVQLNAQVSRIYNIEEKLDLYDHPIHENELAYTQMELLAMVEVAPHVKVGGGGSWVRNASFRRNDNFGTVSQTDFENTKGWIVQLDWDVWKSYKGPTVSLRYHDLKLREEGTGDTYSANNVGISLAWKFGVD